jgi:hypothetical protein
MSSAAPHVDLASTDRDDGGEMILVSRTRLKHLEARASRGELDAQHVQLLREQVTQLKDTLDCERMRSEKQADAFADRARKCEDRAREHEAQYKEMIAQLEARLTANDAANAEQRRSLTEQAAIYAGIAADMKKQVSKLESSHAATVSVKAAHVTLLKKQIAKMEESHAQMVVAKDAAAAVLRTTLANLERELAALRAENTARLADLQASHGVTVAAKDTAAADLRIALVTREREHAALRAETAAQLSAIHTVVTSKFALELHPVRLDRRQFATLHVGPVPRDEFDSAWCAAACGERWTVDIDPLTHMRAQVKQRGSRCLTLRSAAPLPRRMPSIGASPPSYRIIIDAYPAPVDGKGEWCNMGFVPSHTSTDGALVTPVVEHNICHYGGCFLQVQPTKPIQLNAGSAVHGWMPLLPRATAAGDAAAEDNSMSATTNEAPPVPPGSAVEFAVDYAAGTCRVAFYTPVAVAGGFVEAPHAKMELRFVATAAEVLPTWGAIPARSMPTAAADSRMQLYPAVAAGYAGAVWRFV